MSKIELDATGIFIYGAVWTALIGGLGAIIGRYWDSRNHFRDKRDDFKEFLGLWSQEIERVQGYSALGTYNAYLAREGAFVGHVSKLENSFWRKRKFRKLCAPLRQRLPEHFRTDSDCREVVATPIRQLLGWL